VQSQVRGEYRRAGGITGYPLEDLYEEVAYIAYYFHWGLPEILGMEHHDRRMWAGKIADINRKLSGDEEEAE
jgi:hypothetical protein